MVWMKILMQQSKLKNKQKNSKSKISDDYEQLKNLSKQELMSIILQQQKPIPYPRTSKTVSQKPIALPRKNVKQMIQNYEDNIIKPPLEFQDKPIIALPRTRKNVKQMIQNYEENIIKPPLKFKEDYKPTLAPRTKQRYIPLPRTILRETNKALKGYTESYEINIKNNKEPLIQLKNTRKAIEIHIEKKLNEMKGLKFLETLMVT